MGLKGVDVVTEKKSIKRAVYESIYDNIIKGEYTANTIINERELINKYQVSKSPIREALVELCKEGILKSIPRYGYQVVQITPKEICDIQELRLVVELAALGKSINYLDEEAFQKLEESVRQVKFLEHDVLKHWLHNMNFHLLLCSYCQNDIMYQELQRILKFCARGAAQYYFNSWNVPTRADASLHMDLIRALRAKDLPQARKILSQDVSSLKNEVFFQGAPENVKSLNVLP